MPSLLLPTKKATNVVTAATIMPTIIAQRAVRAFGGEGVIVESAAGGDIPLITVINIYLLTVEQGIVWLAQYSKFSSCHPAPFHLLLISPFFCRQHPTREGRPARAGSQASYLISLLLNPIFWLVWILLGCRRIFSDIKSSQVKRFLLMELGL